MTPILLLIFTAIILFLIIFGFKISAFWWSMTTASVFLAAWSIFLNKRDRYTIFKFKGWHIVWGILSAIILYFIFYLGNLICKTLFSSTSINVENIYNLKSDHNTLLIGILMFLIIGPCEEIFWRGLIQRRISDKIGVFQGWLLASIIYAVVHVWSGNFILVMAALTAGLFWGWIFKRTNSIWPCVISHSIWDIVIFIILPIG